jgi:hypothetical protein
LRSGTRHERPLAASGFHDLDGHCRRLLGLGALMTRSDAERIKSWFLSLTMAGFTAEQAIQMIAETIREERMAA